MLKEIEFLINDVRLQSDNNDTNAIKDRELVRYFNDGVKTIQALIYKNNPLCTYFQSSYTFTAQASSRVYDLPTDVYGENAVSMVEISRDGGTTYTPVDRVWPEEGGAFFGWFIRGRQLYISGDPNLRLDGQLRIWYFYRLPRFDKVWATVSGAPAGQVITIANIDTEMFRVDRFITILTPAGAVRVENISYTKTTDTTITVVGDISTVLSGDLILMGKSSSLEADLPEECEPYIMDYVAQRIAGRQAYGEDWNKMNFWTAEERSNIMAIFADASQAVVRGPVLDTEYMRV